MYPTGDDDNNNRNLRQREGNDNGYHKMTTHDDDDCSPYTISITSRFFLVSFVTTSLLAFVTGMITIQMYHVSFLKRYPITTTIMKTTQHFIINEPNSHSPPRDDNDPKEAGQDENEDTTSVHKPALGHQIFVQLKNVHPSFRFSQPKLINAMQHIIQAASLSIRSYHCTERLSRDALVGISCFGILSKNSHISLQSWNSRPGSHEDDDDGMITLDLLSSERNQSEILHTIISVVETEFATPGRNIRLVWTQRLRQNRYELLGYKRNSYAEDLGVDFLPKRDLLKIHISSSESIYQQIDIYDILNPKTTSLQSHHLSLTNESSSYESQNPHLFQPNRIIFLDGVAQSTRHTNEAYHEALVQPAMFAHDHPRRVAIIGGGEGATLREVLKHATLQKAIMIDIDEMMVKESSKYLYPEWNGCGHLENATSLSCFEDARADVRCEDALAWFMNRFHECEDTEDELCRDLADSLEDEEEEEDVAEEEVFDVIIMDALDPQDTVEFANVLYQNNVFLKSLYNALGEDGILVAQLGESPEIVDIAEEIGDKNRAAVKRNLIEVGFQSIHIYEESHCGFDWPWTFLIACKSTNCRSNWYANPAQIDASIHNRILRSTSSSIPHLLEYFDGATMASYQVPRKAVETVYCHKVPTPHECDIVATNSIPASLIRNKTEGDVVSYRKGTDDVVVRIPSQSIQVLSRKGGDPTSQSIANLLDTFGVKLSIMGDDDRYFSPGTIVKTGSNVSSYKPQENILLMNDIDPDSPVVARRLPHFANGLYHTMEKSFG